MVEGVESFPAHLTACDDGIADISVLPVPAPLTGCIDVAVAGWMWIWEG